MSQLAAEYSECPSGKKGGDLGWFPRGKMAGPFQDVAFSTEIGATSAPFKSTYVLSPISSIAIDSGFSILSIHFLLWPMANGQVFLFFLNIKKSSISC